MSIIRYIKELRESQGDVQLVSSRPRKAFTKK